MSFADTFGNGAPTETPYQQLSGAPPVQMGTVKKELRANLRVITDMTAGVPREPPVARRASRLRRARRSPRLAAAARGLALCTSWRR